MKKLLITFSGLDGSGKSTLLETVAFHQKEVKVVHLVHFRLVNRLRGKHSGSKSSSSPDKNPSRLSGWLNAWLMLIDVIVFNIYYFLSRRPVVCDRYFYDLLAVHLYRHKKSWFLPIIVRFAKKPSAALFIEVDPTDAFKREDDGGHELEYFKSMNEIYTQQIIPRYGREIIKNDSLDAAKQTVLKRVGKAGLV